MTHSFNLIDRAWIPCSKPDGALVELSLQQTLAQAHHLREIAGSTPLETAALYRLLLAVLHSALRGPENSAAWRALWKTGKWEGAWLEDYLSQWKNRFDLFDHERPFYQAQNGQTRSKSVINLVMEMAAGNNAVLFDHHTEDSGATLSAAQAARLVVTVQTFGLAGLCDPQQKLTFTDAPWARGVVFLIEGNNVFETLALNLLRYDVERSRPHGLPATFDDRPAWERDNPYDPERDIPTGYLDYLTWQNRRILLIPQGEAMAEYVQTITVAPGLRLNSALLDPMKHYRRNAKSGNMLELRFSEERALWRDSATLFQTHDLENTRPPQNFVEAAERFYDAPGYSKLRAMALGMANDQAKIEFFRHEHLPLPLRYLESEGLVGQLAAAMQSAEDVHRVTNNAVTWLALLIVAPHADGKKWQEVDKVSKQQAAQLTSHWASERLYWAELERPFFHLLEDLPDHGEQALNEWGKVLQTTAWKALDYAANLAGESPTALKAAVRARTALGASLKDLFPNRENKEVTTQ